MDTMQAYRFHPEVAVPRVQPTGAGRTSLLCTLCRAHIDHPENSEFSISQLKMLLRQVEKILERKISLGEWQKL